MIRATLSWKNADMSDAELTVTKNPEVANAPLYGIVTVRNAQDAKRMFAGIMENARKCGRPIEAWTHGQVSYLYVDWGCFKLSQTIGDDSYVTYYNTFSQFANENSHLVSEFSAIQYDDVVKVTREYPGGKVITLHYIK